MYILAGFSDKLRLMNLLIDDIKTFREFHVRNCTSCAFSCGGHLLAAVSHNKISVFSSVDFRNTVSETNCVIVNFVNQNNYFLMTDRTLTAE